LRICTSELTGSIREKPGIESIDARLDVRVDVEAIDLENFDAASETGCGRRRIAMRARDDDAPLARLNESALT
jgi:hypothetical protein